ncbi:MAG: (2Fe-2S)-binding protein [Myxococcales bacterium]
MRASPPSLSLESWAVRLSFDVHPGQPIVLAFSHAIGLRESPELRRIRAELRGLGAALLWFDGTQVFTFQPDDALDLNGTSRSFAVAARRDLRTSCGLEPEANDDHELSLVVVSGEGIVVGRHRASANDGLRALADALTIAGREVIAPRHPLFLSRRDVVLASLVGAFALLASGGCDKPPPKPAPTPSAEPQPLAKTVQLTLNINGQPHSLEVEPRVSLLDALRERLSLTGSKKGCDHGQCGACTVLVDGRRVNACLTLAVMVGNAPITTIEGLAQGEHLHPMQAAFVKEDALQCGYCTPGQVMSALGLVRENRAHSDAEVREHMSGNICRCGAYSNIVAAIQRARSESTHG